MNFITIIRDSFMGFVSQIKEINRKYAVPHIKMSPSVRFSLILLRVYLVLLIGILFYKFYTLVK
ncbi:MAG: hypothetical protein HQL26_05685 [Candidatus Omnitrophica bacterium]|nr:hypothetical protein [Candidatus Omnitrophota bacterium]